MTEPAAPGRREDRSSMIEHEQLIKALLVERYRLTPRPATAAPPAPDRLDQPMPASTNPPRPGRHAINDRVAERPN
jgi:hypothetical protein